MKLTNKIFTALIKKKNGQIKRERELRRQKEQAFSILSAYVAMLALRHGNVWIAKDAISEYLGKFSVRVEREGGFYKFYVSDCPERLKKLAKTAVLLGDGEADACELHRAFSAEADLDEAGAKCKGAEGGADGEK